MRYYRIFQRTDDELIGIKVSCITDRDIPPKEAKDFKYMIKKRGKDEYEERSLLSENRKTEDEYLTEEIRSIENERKAKYRGGDVEVFMPITWPLEFEISKSCFRKLMYRSIEIALQTNNLEKELTKNILDAIEEKYDFNLKRWEQEKKNDNEIAVEIYSPILRLVYLNS